MDFISSSLNAAAAAVDACTGVVVVLGVLAALAGPVRFGFSRKPWRSA